MNIATWDHTIAPFTEVEFELYFCEKRRRCRGIVQPLPYPILGCVLIDYEVWIEPEFTAIQLGNGCDSSSPSGNRIHRGTVQLPANKVKPLNLAGHGKDPRLIQLSLLEAFDAAPPNPTQERVLGGDESLKTRESNATHGYVENHACGWIEIHKVKRERKKKDDQGRANVWTNKQYWLHWEESGGRKRSRYIPKSKYADVEESVYGLKAPLEETLKLLEEKK